jgi:hypothetical protein
VTSDEARRAHTAAMTAYRAGQGPRPLRRSEFVRAIRAGQPTHMPPDRVTARAVAAAKAAEASVPNSGTAAIPEPAYAPAPAPKPAAARLCYDSRIVCVINDVHIPNQHPVAWAAFRAWHASVRPHETIVLGDGIDLAAASRFALDDKDTPFLVDEFKAFAREINALATECGTLTIAEGNHEARLMRSLAGVNATALRGLGGISFREIATANGLTAPVQWFRESLTEPGLVRGQFLLQHGDRQAGRFGGGIHLGANSIAKSNGQSIVRGHHHRGQIFARTAYGKTAFGVASPCLVRDMDYAGGQSADWQRGWSVLELAGPDYTLATPHVLFVIDGVVSWGGRTWRAAA